MDDTGDDKPRAPARRPGVRSLLGALVGLVLAGLLVALVVLGIDVLLAAFGGVLLAVFLRALADLLKRYVPMRDGFALSAVILLLVGVASGLAVALAPQIDRQLTQVGETLPTIAQEVSALLERSPWGRWVLERVQTDGAPAGVADAASGGLTALLATVSEWSGHLLTTVFVGLFAAANPWMYKVGLTNLFPLAQRERVARAIDEIGYTLRWWLVGQALSMLVTGVSTTILLLAFGVPLAWVVGPLVGLLGFVPYLGQILGALPVALLAAPQGTDTLILVMIAYTIVQMLEGYVVTPIIQHRTVYLPPVLTIVSQLLLGAALGALGFVFATPLAAVGLVLTRYYKAYFLGDPEALET